MALFLFDCAFLERFTTDGQVPTGVSRPVHQAKPTLQFTTREMHREPGYWLQPLRTWLLLGHYWLLLATSYDWSISTLRSRFSALSLFPCRVPKPEHLNMFYFCGESFAGINLHGLCGDLA